MLDASVGHLPDWNRANERFIFEFWEAAPGGSRLAFAAVSTYLWSVAFLAVGMHHTVKKGASMHCQCDECIAAANERKVVRE